MTEPGTEDWAAIGTLPLGDARRNARLAAVLDGLCARPAGCVSQVFDVPAEAKAAYRLLARAEQWQAPLAAALREGCLARVASHERVLAIQDTTHLDFAASPANGEDGFWLHTLLAVTPAGLPLGVLHQHFWQRDPAAHGVARERKTRPLAAKESRRWLDALAGVGGDDWPAATRVLVVSDRESDLFEYFAAPRPATCELLVRAAQPRRVSGPAGDLWAAVQALPVADERPLLLPRRPERALRRAALQLRYGPVTIQPPRAAAAAQEPLGLWVVAVAETAPPPGETPVEWVLLTTAPVRTVAEAWANVDDYCRRWLIERFHYTLKSGCHIEASQLREGSALQAWVTLFSYVAWRLLWLTYLGRTAPQAPATVALTTLEWQTLVRLRAPRQSLRQPPPLGQALAWLAQLGGHPGRRGDGFPGVKVLWRGFTRLQDIVLGVLLVTTAPHPDVGNA